jgi:hypothetical protein
MRISGIAAAVPSRCVRATDSIGQFDEETIQKITILGASGYIRKPFTLQDILDPVNELMLRRTAGG